MPKFGTKNALFGYFRTEIWWSHCHIWNQRSRIWLIAKFCENTRRWRFGTKNALFRYFWSGIWKQHCHIWNQHPRICLIAKFCEKMKRPKFGTKNVFFGYFCAKILKNNCHIWNQHPRICQKLVFDSTVNFGIGSGFSNGTGFFFSQGRSPGQGLTCSCFLWNKWFERSPYFIF